MGSWKSLNFFESQEPNQKEHSNTGLVAGFLKRSHEMTDTKSTLDLVIYIFKSKSGPENLVRGQEGKKIFGNCLQRVKISAWFQTILTAYLQHYNHEYLYSNLYTFMKENAI